MKDTVKALLESVAMPQIDFLSKNTASLHILRSVTEAERMTTTFTPSKVMVCKNPDGGYIVEYANNLERLMLDRDLGISEAMQVVADVNDIPVSECTVIFDESCVDKIDIEAVIKLDPDFDLARK